MCQQKCPQLLSLFPKALPEMPPTPLPPRPPPRPLSRLRLRHQQQLLLNEADPQIFTSRTQSWQKLNEHWNRGLMELRLQQYRTLGPMNPFLSPCETTRTVTPSTRSRIQKASAILHNQLKNTEQENSLSILVSAAALCSLTSSNEEGNSQKRLPVFSQETLIRPQPLRYQPRTKEWKPVAPVRKSNA